MKAVILNGAAKGDDFIAAVDQAILERLQTLDFSVERYIPAEMNVAYCLGDFKCWTRTPGVCALNDENRTVARAVAQSNLLVYLTPVTFGGYSSELKKAVDHLIQIASPFFMNYEGETHHKLRYDHTPALFAVGVLPARDIEAEEIFTTLVRRNALNLHNAGHASFLARDQEITEAANTVVNELQSWIMKVECFFSWEVREA